MGPSGVEEDVDTSMGMSEGCSASPSEKNFATKQQVAMLLGLGREILLLLKLVMAAVMVLCVLCFIVVMKK